MFLPALVIPVSGSLSDTTLVSVANNAVYRVDVSDTVGSIEGAGNITTGAQDVKTALDDAAKRILAQR